MIWDPVVTWGDVLTFMGLSLAAISVFFAGRDFRRNVKVQRAQFLMDITQRYFHDDEVRRFFYRLDYGEFRLNLDDFILSDEELWLDDLLYTFDTIGRVVRLGAVGIDEVQILAFQASRVLRNPQVVKYLEWLDGEYQREGRQTRAHDDARWLVERL